KRITNPGAERCQVVSFKRGTQAIRSGSSDVELARIAEPHVRSFAFQAEHPPVPLIIVAEKPAGLGAARIQVTRSPVLKRSFVVCVPTVFPSAAQLQVLIYATEHVTSKTAEVEASPGVIAFRHCR